MILKMSEWAAYLPLICFLDIILMGKRGTNGLLTRIIQAATLILGLYSMGILLVNILGYWIDVHSVPHLFKVLRWNIHNILLFLLFMIIKICRNRKNQQILFRISIVSCIFAVTQIVFYTYLFLSNLEGLTADIIGVMHLCSMVILCIQGAMLELMERNILTQTRQNEDEKILLEKKYEQDYYQLAMEQKELVHALQEEIKNQLLQVEDLTEQSAFQSEEKIQELLVELEEKVGRVGKVVFCKDSVLNTVLALKNAAAHKAGLTMQVCVDSYIKTKVEDYDLCGIITNILDNAIEAAKRVKESGKEALPIEVHIGHRAGYLVLKVRNPIVEPLRKNKKGQYVSSKKENGSLKRHGRGVTIVENALKKYGGNLRFEENENYMTVFAFLPVVK